MRLPNPFLLLPVLFVAGLLAGCQAAPRSVEERSEIELGAGAELILHVPVTVPPRSGRAYIQYGVVLADRHGLNPYHPYCMLFVNTLADAPRVYGPTRYPIASWSHQQDSLVSTGPLQVAQVAGDGDDGDAGPTVNLTTRFVLNDATTPEMRSLVCGQWSDLAEARYLELGAIRKTLGGAATLDLGR